MGGRTVRGVNWTAKKGLQMGIFRRGKGTQLYRDAEKARRG